MNEDEQAELDALLAISIRTDEQQERMEYLDGKKLQLESVVAKHRRALDSTGWKHERGIERGEKPGKAWCEWRALCRHRVNHPELGQVVPPEPPFADPVSLLPPLGTKLIDFGEVGRDDEFAVLDATPVFPDPDDDPLADIPANLRGFIWQDETPVRFTLRMRSRYRALKHMQMDMMRPTNNRTFPDMNEEEVEELKKLDAMGAETLAWLNITD